MPEPVRILLIEDDAATVRMLGEWLRSAFGPTIHVESVGTVSLGVEHILNHPPDVVLLDLILPDSSDGLATLNRISDLVCPSQIVLVTGYATAQTEFQATAIGAAGLVRKDDGFDQHFLNLVKGAIEISRKLRVTESRTTEQLASMAAVLRDIQSQIAEAKRDLQRQITDIKEQYKELDMIVRGTAEEPGINARIRRYETGAKWLWGTFGVSIGGAIATAIVSYFKR